MGRDLFDKKTEDICSSVNSWHWGAIVEEIKRLKVFPDDIVD